MKVTNMLSMNHPSLRFPVLFVLFLSIPLLNAYGQGDDKDTNPCFIDNIKKILKKICYKEHFSEGNCFDKVYKKIDEMNGDDFLDGIKVMYYVCEKQSH